MEKDDTTLASIFCTALILLMIVFLFAIWGGHPRGVYWKIEDLRAELNKIKLGNEVKPYKDGEQDNWIEILRTQINQLKILP